MLNHQSPPTSGVASAWLDPPRQPLSPEEKAREFARQLVRRGVDPDLATDAAVVLAFKPVPWSPTDQAIVKRAWFQCWDGLGQVLEDEPCLPQE